MVGIFFCQFVFIEGNVLFKNQGRGPWPYIKDKGRFVFRKKVFGFVIQDMYLAENQSVGQKYFVKRNNFKENSGSSSKMYTWKWIKGGGEVALNKSQIRKIIVVISKQLEVLFFRDNFNGENLFY